jgi:hypothetical protein
MVETITPNPVETPLKKRQYPFRKEAEQDLESD